MKNLVSQCLAKFPDKRVGRLLRSIVYAIRPDMLTVDSNITLSAEAHNDMIINVNKTAGVTITLPPADAAGVKLDFTVAATVTGSHIIQVAQSGDIMYGFATFTNSGGSAFSQFYTSTASGGHDTITMNGTTTGGLKGNRVSAITIGANAWSVRYDGQTTGTPATPFTSTVGK